MPDSPIHTYLASSILEDLPVAVLKLDREYRVVYCNTSVLAVLGKSKTEAMGRLFFDLIPEFERAKIEFLYQNLSFISSSYSNSHYQEDFSSLITHKIFPDSEGITVLLEKEVFRYTPSSDKNEARFKELLDELPGGILVFDSHSGRVVYSNKVIQEWLGYATGEMEKLNLANLYPKRDLEFISNGFSRIGQSQKNTFSGVSLLTKKKETLPVEMTIVPVEWNTRPCHCVYFIDVRSKEESVRIHAEWEKYREILGQLAVRFINIPSSKLTKAVEETLELAGRLSNSDRAFVMRFDIKTELAHTDYTWVAGSLPSFEDNFRFLPLGILSPIWESLQTKNIVEYSDVETLPDEHPVKNILHLLKIESLVLLPIGDGDRFYGVVGFGKVKSKISYSELELFPIRMASEIISSTLMREKMEQLLIESEQENQKLFNNSPVGLIYQDSQGDLLKANPAALDLLDLSIEQLIGRDVIKSDWKAFTEDGNRVNSFNDPGRECLKTGKPQIGRIMSVIRPSKQDRVWLSIDSLPEFKKGSQEATGVFTTIKDITEQKKYLNSVILAEKRYRSLVENLPGVVYSCKVDEYFTPIHLTDKVFELTGYSLDDFLTSRVKILDLIHPQDHKKVVEETLKAIRLNIPFQLSYRITTKSGDVRWVEDRGELIQPELEDGYIIGFWNDITDRVESGIALEKNLKLLEAIVENSHSAIFVKDLDSTYIMVNRRWEIITGFSREHVIGKKIEDFLGDGLAQKYIDDDRKVLLEGKVTFAEEKLEHQETISDFGNTQYFLSVKFPYRNNQGQIIGMCGISTDITAVKEASVMVEEREANLHGILESVNESIWSLDKNLNILFTNQTFFNEFFQAYGVELIKGMNIINTLPDPIEKQKWSSRYREVLKSGKTLQFSEKILTPFKINYLDVVIYPIKVNGQVEGVSVFSKDLTEKIALEESSRLYLNLFESATNEIYLISAKSLTIKQSNQAAQKNTGYSKEEFPGISILKLIDEKDHALFLKQVSAISSKKIPSFFLELDCRRKNGTVYPTEVLLQLFTYEGEDYLSAFVTDISDRKRTLFALQESELRFSQIFKENVTPMLLIDPSTGKIEDANPSAASYYGFDLGKLKSLHLLDVNHTFVEHPEEMEAVIKEVLESGKGKFLFEHKLNSGEIRSVEVFCSKISIDNRQLVHEIIQDVTDRNNFYNAVVKQNEALREIAWIQSHVVRAPLAKIMGLVQLLHDEKENKDESLMEFIMSAILNAASELDRVILDISEKSNNAKHLID